MGLRLRLVVLIEINHTTGIWMTLSTISAVFSTWKSFVSQICDTKGLVHAPGPLKGPLANLWRTHCNRTRYTLKRSVSASCRFKNYEKRLISFGITTQNVKLIFSNRMLFLWWKTRFPSGIQLEFQLPGQGKLSVF